MRVTVFVRIDRPLEAGDQLVGPRVDRPAAGDVLLPARDADRQHRGARRHPGESFRPAGPDEQACHLGPVSLEPRGVVRLGRGERMEVAVAEHVDSVLDASSEERLRPVDAGVEERDRDSAAVEARQHDLRAMRSAARELVLGQELRGDRRWVGDARRIDAGHLGLPFQQRDRLGVERGREPVDDPREVVVDPHLHPVLRQRGQDLLLRGEGRGGPLPLLRVGRPPA